MLQWLEDSWLAAAIRQSLWLYPALEIVHIIGIVLLVGPALMFDARVLGLSPSIPVASLSGHLLPWAKRGLGLLIIPSGILLFSTNAVTLAGDPVFWLKLSLLAVAIANAFIFHRIFKPEADGNSTIPFRAKVNAFLSIVLWLMIIACGRLLAY
jgi:hypothetical protein